MAVASRELELLVAKIQRALAPEAEVIHDTHLPGRHSKRDRQIDVLVRQRIGQYEMNIVLDCKDHGRPVDVKGVEEFHGLLDDVGAHKGALVCPKGFSRAAKERAKGLQVDLYSPVDTDPHKWQVRPTAPALCDFREAMVAFRIAVTTPKPFKLPYDFWSSCTVVDGAGNDLGTPLPFALRKWEAGKFPTEPGEHQDLKIFDAEATLVDSGYGDKIEVTLTVDVLVRQAIYFGHIPIVKLSGFRDELTGNVITNAFTLGILNPDEVERTWTRLENASEAPITPLLKLTGLIGYAR